jgi:hypothetical protein
MHREYQLCLSFFPTIFFFFSQRDIETGETANKRLRTSKHLHRVLEVVLAFGNYMNGGTKQGGAYGFRPSALEKASLFNKTTLLLQKARKLTLKAFVVCS